MEYIRQNLEFASTPAAGRARGILRAEVRDQALKIRILLENIMPAPFGTYSAEMISVKDGFYRRYPLGMIRTDNRGRGELLFRQSLGKQDGPGVEDFQVFRIIRVRPTPTELLTARVDHSVNWQELPEWGNPNNNEEKLIIPEEIQGIEPEPTPIPEPVILPEKQPEKEMPDYLMEKMPGIHPFYQSELKWVRLDPADLSVLPIDLMAVEKSPFIMNGYTRYKHLILGQDIKGWQLGVPYRYVPEMAQAGMAEGFLEFRPAHAQAAKKGDFGYWIRHIPLEK